MRYFITLAALVGCLAIAASVAVAGNAQNIEPGQPKQEGRQHRRPPKKEPANMGFIADPLPAKPLGFKVAKPPVGTGTPLVVTESNLIAVTPSPTRVAPVVRDHTLPNPNALPPNYNGPGRSNEISGGGFGLGNPFSFIAPLQFDKLDRDHRTDPTTSWTPNTQGPANTVPVKPNPRKGR